MSDEELIAEARGAMTEYQFIGSETANLPYRPGKVYRLQVRPGGWRERMRGWSFIIEAPFFCPYTSMEAFMRNWKLVDADPGRCEVTPAEVIATVIETHKDHIGTHYPECWKYHAGCLALLLRDLGENNE